MRVQLLILIISSSPFFAFSFPVTELECEFNITNWDRIGEFRTCTVQNPQIFKQASKKFSLNANLHREIETNHTALGFRVQNCSHLMRFPHGIEILFPDLSALEISNTHLSELKMDDFENFLNLTVLRLHSNRLKSIPNQLFKHTRMLISIWLNDNEIRHIDPFVFDNLKSLAELRVAGNRCNRNLQDATGEDRLKKLTHQIESSQCSSFFDDFVAFREGIEMKVDKLTQTAEKHQKNNQLLLLIVICITAFVGVIVTVIAAIIIKLNA